MEGRALEAAETPNAPQIATSGLLGGRAGLVGVLGAHLPRDRYDDAGGHAYTVCSCGGWTGDYFAEGEAGPFDDHLADAVLAWLGGLLAGDEVREAATNG